MRSISIPPVSDFHIHLRSGKLMKMAVTALADSGVRTAYVMPNLHPPITTTEKALQYQSELKKIAPDVTFLMSLYLTPELTVEELRKAKRAGIRGVKVYPKGVTTNSASGVVELQNYYGFFAEMEKLDMVLNLHGEVPTDESRNICILNAEHEFLSTLVELHRQFPGLKIVLEHATTRQAVETVLSLGETVACTITAHHLYLTVDQWAGQNHNYCKPVPKYPDDREALREVVRQGHPRFFLGSDSAPHPQTSKECSYACAGVFTTPNLLSYLAEIFDKLDCLDKLGDFTSRNGNKFYGLDDGSGLQDIQLYEESMVIPGSFKFGEDQAVIPFMAGESLKWKINRL